MELKNKLKEIYATNESFRKVSNKIHFLLSGNSRSLKGEINTIEASEAILKNVSIDIQGDYNSVIFEKGTRLTNCKVIIRGSKHKLLVGKNCNVKNGVFWVEDENCLISLGDGTSSEGAHIAVTEPNSKIEIGKDCMFSSGIDIRNGDSHSILDLNSGDRINYAKDIMINDHVWLGANVQVLKGVEIGSNSIIGVRSIVTKNIPANTIATGIPAKVTKEGVTWTRKRTYK